jgi:predicted amidohydrolase
MRAGFFQFKPVFGNISHNLTKVLKSLDGVSADLIVLPELPFTGYNFKDRNEVRQLSESVLSSTIIAELTALCKTNNFHIVTGFAEKAKEKLFNSAILISPEGPQYTYRKLHLFNKEKDWFDPGDIELLVQNVKDMKIGVMICFDWIFPEVTRCLALNGADIICHPSNLVLKYCQKAMITRSLENNIFTITANRYGSDKRTHGTIRFTGSSQVTTPKGEIVFSAPAQKESLFVAHLDVDESRNKYITGKNHVLGDRRPEFYSPITQIDM